MSGATEVGSTRTGLRRFGTRVGPDLSGEPISVQVRGRYESVSHVVKSKYLSDQEIEARMYGLTAPDCVRLERTAAIYCGGTDWTPSDLLQEALLATLERRAWRADLDTVVFLTGVMRSLVHSRRKTQRISALDQALDVAEESADILDQIEASQEDNPENIASNEESARVLLEQLQECFEGDHEVQRVIQGRAHGESASSIKGALGMNQTEYETACRRLVRGYQTRIKVKQS